MNSKKTLTLMGCIAIALILIFQNCGDVRLAHKETSTPLKVEPGRLTAKLCPSLSSTGKSNEFSFESVFISNLNLTHYQGKVLLDSDADGVADERESPSSIVVRRPNDVLEGVCLATGICTKPTNCQGIAIAPGLTDCDLAVYGLASPQGIDSDGDKIPDLLEVLRGTLIAEADDSGQYDTDSITNLEEIRKGSDVWHEASPAEALVFKYSEGEINEKCNEGKQVVKRLNVNYIPLVETKEYVDDKPWTVGASTISLSHAKNENVIAIFYKSRPFGTGAAEVYMYLVKMKYGEPMPTVDINPTDFVFIGNVN